MKPRKSVSRQTWHHTAVGDCNTLTATWAHSCYHTKLTKKKRLWSPNLGPTAPYTVLCHNKSYLQGEPFDNVPLADKLCKSLAWEEGFAECWGRAKRLRSSTMQYLCRQKASWGDTSGEPVETSADSKAFLMSLHHEATRCPEANLESG